MTTILYKNKDFYCVSGINIRFNEAYSKIHQDRISKIFKFDFIFEVSEETYYFLGWKQILDNGSHKIDELYFMGIKVVANKEVPDDEIRMTDI